jgi:hypothetical protein
MKTIINTSWKFQATDSLDKTKFVDLHFERINEITLEAFECKIGFTEEELLKALNTSTFFGFVEDPKKQIQGFSFFTISKESLNGRKFLWLDKMAISKSARGNRLMLELVKNVRLNRPNEVIGYFGGCTQSTDVINTIAKMGEMCFPIDSCYGTKEGNKIWTYILLHIEQFKDRLTDSKKNLDIELNSNFGILKNVYPQCINVSTNSLKPEFAQLFKDQNFEPDKGDLIVMVSKL